MTKNQNPEARSRKPEEKNSLAYSEFWVLNSGFLFY